MTFRHLIISTVKGIRQSACLGTTSTVAASAAQHTAHDTLTGVTIAERAMNECFHFRASLFCDVTDFRQSQFSAQNHFVKALFIPVIHVCQRIRRHLCAGMEREIGVMFPHQFCSPSILHDQRIYAHTMQFSNKLDKFRQFFIFINCIYCNIYLHTAQMTIVTSFFQFFQRKISRILSGAE